MGHRWHSLPVYSFTKSGIHSWESWADCLDVVSFENCPRHPMRLSWACPAAPSPLLWPIRVLSGKAACGLQERECVCWGLSCEHGVPNGRSACKIQLPPGGKSSYGVEGPECWGSHQGSWTAGLEWIFLFIKKKNLSSLKNLPKEKLWERG